VAPGRDFGVTIEQIAKPAVWCGLQHDKTTPAAAAAAIKHAGSSGDKPGRPGQN